MCMCCAVRHCRAKSISSHRNVCLELYRCLLRATIRKNLQAALPNPSLFLSLCLPATIKKEQRSPLCFVWQQASITNVLTRQPQNVSTLWSLCLGFKVSYCITKFSNKSLTFYFSMIVCLAFLKWWKTVNSAATQRKKYHRNYCEWAYRMILFHTNIRFGGRELSLSNFEAHIQHGCRCWWCRKKP